VEVFADGATAVIDDFQVLTLYRGGTRSAETGHPVGYLPKRDSLVRVLYATTFGKDLETLSHNPGVKKSLLALIEIFHTVPVRGSSRLTDDDVHIKMYTSEGGVYMEFSAAEFRKNFFKILGQVEQTRKEIVITKRGKPVAKLISINNDKKKDPLLGALAGLGRTTGNLTEPVVDDEAWELD
jgi:prevent-host-death family protein